MFKSAHFIKLNTLNKVLLIKDFVGRRRWKELDVRCKRILYVFNVYAKKQKKKRFLANTETCNESLLI